MKALLVLMVIILAAGTALAYGRADAEVTTFVEETASALASEPVVLLLSGGLLIAIAGAVRRLPI